VVLCRPGMLVVALPKHGNALAIAVAHGSWMATRGSASALAALSSGYTTGEKVKAVVVSTGVAAPQVADDAADATADAEETAVEAAAKRGARSCPLVVRLAASSTREDALLSAASDALGPSPLRRRSDARPGTHALGRVVAVEPTELRVRLDRKGALQGILHLTETVEPGEEAKLPSVAVDSSIHVVVLGGAGGSKAPADNGEKGSAMLQLSVRPSLLSAAAPPASMLTRAGVGALSAGDRIEAWVLEVAEKHLWVGLSTTVRGLVAKEHALSAEEGAELSATFRIGQPLSAYVLSTQAGRLRLALRKPRAGDFEAAVSKHRAAGPSHAAIAAAAAAPVAGTVVRARDGVGVDVRLDEQLLGRAHVTEVTDEWVENPLVAIPSGKVVDVVVLGAAPNGRSVDVSMRRSVLKAALARPGAEAAAQEHARPASVGELSKGQLVRGYVKAVSKRGCFVTLSRSVDAFVGLKYVADEFVDEKELHDKLPVGQLVVGRVLTASSEENKVSLSLRMSDMSGGEFRQALAFADLYTGMVVTGVIRRVVDFGVFVRLHGSEKLDALCHKSEVADRKVRDLEASFKVGALVKGVVLRTNAEKQQIAISLKPSRLLELGDGEGEDGGVGGEEEGDEGEEEGEEEGGVEAGAGVVGGREGGGDEDGDDESDGGDDDDDDDDDGGEVDVDSEGGGGDDDEEDDVDSGEVEDANARAAAAAAAKSSRADPLAMPRVSCASAPPSALSAGFEFDDFEAAGAPTSAPSPPAPPDGAAGRRSKRAREGASQRQREEDLAEQEARLRDAEEAPQTADDYERLLVGAPSSSYLWVQYMQLQLSLAEVERARQVGERALKSIDLREEDERYNVWVAMINLEKAHGTDESLGAIFRRAIAGSSPQPIYMHMAATHERSGDAGEADAVYTAASKRFRSDKAVWLAWLGSLMRRGEFEAGKELLQSTVDSLPKAEHVEVISKFGQLEFRHGSAERGRTVFDGVLASYPRRVDVWSVYLDMELRAGIDEAIRRLFERVISLKLSSKKIKFFFKRYLEYARSTSDDELVQHVKNAAREWVEKAAAA